VYRWAKLEYKWTVLSVTTVGVLMSGIDSRILIIGLPQIASVMHADAEQAVWFTEGYVSYAVITQVISTIIPLGAAFADRALFMGGLKLAYVWLAALNSFALVPSVLGIMKKR